MIEYIDPFHNKTIIEVLPAQSQGGVRFVIKKERTALYEFWDVETAKKILTELQQAIGVNNEI